MLDRIINKSEDQSVQEVFGPLLSRTRKIMGDDWSDAANGGIMSSVCCARWILKF